MPPESTQPPPLTASYTSPDNQPFRITKSLDTPPPASSAHRLAALRKAVTETQQLINQELTARMEQDKLRGSAAGPAGARASSLAADEDKEEENYGEEVQGE
ncbi:hypothetical protein E4U41_001667, partial [Claviceps citrina]